MCVDEDVEHLILAKVEGSGHSAHMKELVWREVEREGVRVGEVERTVYNTITSSGMYHLTWQPQLLSLGELQSLVPSVPHYSSLIP